MGYMEWAAAPKRSHRYSVRTGDDCQFCSTGGDPTSYVPDEIMPIYIRAYDYFHPYRGFIIHAKDEEGNVVGEWETPSDLNPLFHAPCYSPGIHYLTNLNDHNNSLTNPNNSLYRSHASCFCRCQTIRVAYELESPACGHRASRFQLFNQRRACE